MQIYFLAKVVLFNSTKLQSSEGIFLSSDPFFRPQESVHPFLGRLTKV